MTSASKVLSVDSVVKKDGNMAADDNSAYLTRRCQYSQPKEVAFFSKGGTADLTFDKSALPLYQPPPIGANLEQAFDEFVRDEEAGE